MPSSRMRPLRRLRKRRTGSVGEQCQCWDAGSLQRKTIFLRLGYGRKSRVHVHPACGGRTSVIADRRSPDTVEAVRMARFETRTAALAPVDTFHWTTSVSASARPSVRCCCSPASLPVFDDATAAPRDRRRGFLTPRAGASFKSRSREPFSSGGSFAGARLLPVANFAARTFRRSSHRSGVETGSRARPRSRAICVLSISSPKGLTSAWCAAGPRGLGRQDADQLTRRPSPL